MPLAGGDVRQRPEAVDLQFVEEVVGIEWSRAAGESRIARRLRGNDNPPPDIGLNCVFRGKPPVIPIESIH